MTKTQRKERACTSTRIKKLKISLGLNKVKCTCLLVAMELLPTLPSISYMSNFLTEEEEAVLLPAQTKFMSRAP
jgi:hypothetical protein